MVEQRIENESRVMWTNNIFFGPVSKLKSSPLVERDTIFIITRMKREVEEFRFSINRDNGMLSLTPSHSRDVIQKYQFNVMVILTRVESAWSLCMKSDTSRTDIAAIHRFSNRPPIGHQMLSESEISMSGTLPMYCAKWTPVLSFLYPLYCTKPTCLMPVFVVFVLMDFSSLCLNVSLWKCVSCLPLLIPAAQLSAKGVWNFMPLLDLSEHRAISVFWKTSFAISWFDTIMSIEWYEYLTYRYAGHECIRWIQSYRQVVFFS